MHGNFYGREGRINQVKIYPGDFTGGEINRTDFYGIEEETQ